MGAFVLCEKLHCQNQMREWSGMFWWGGDGESTCCSLENTRIDAGFDYTIIKNALFSTEIKTYALLYISWPWPSWLTLKLELMRRRQWWKVCSLGPNSVVRTLGKTLNWDFSNIDSLKLFKILFCYFFNLMLSPVSSVRARYSNQRLPTASSSCYIRSNGSFGSAELSSTNRIR